jgi:four helix bundle protein
VFITYEVAKQLVREIAPLVPAIRRFDADLAKQMTRAGSSIMLNLGEGSRRRGGDQRRFWEFAHGSAAEIRTALDCAECWGWSVDSAQARVTLDRLLALLWRLANGKGRPA